jgi:hypothetical protein
MSEEKREVLKVHPVLSKNLDIEQSMSVGVFRGFAEQNGVHQSSDNLNDNTSQKWSYIVPSIESITDLELYWHVRQQVNFTVGAAAATWGDSVALGPYAPLQQLRQIIIGFNNTSLTLDFTLCLNELLKFYESKHDTDFHSATTNQLDEYVNDYADAINATLYKDINVLGASHHTYKRGRGSYPVDIQVVADDNAKITYGSGVASAGLAANADSGVLFDMTVPLIMSPLKFKEFLRAQWSVTGLNRLDVTLLFSGPERVIRQSGAIVSNIHYPSQTFHVSELVFTSYRAFPDTQPKPLQILPYHDVQSRAVSINAPVSNASKNVVVSTGVITTTCIPEYIIVTVGKNKSQLKSTDSDSYYTINAVNGVYCEKVILNTLNQFQLWQLARRAGSHQTYEQWAGRMFLRGQAGIGGGASGIVGTTGSMLILKPGDSFPLPANLSAGSIYTSQLNLDLTVTPNYSSAQWTSKANSENPEITVCFLYPAYMATSNGNSTYSVGLLGSADIANAIKQVESGEKVYSSEYVHMVGGASAMNNFKSVMKYGAPLLKDMLKNSMASAVADVTGLGRSFGAKRHPML